MSMEVKKMESIKRKVIRWLINRADSSELSEIVQEVLRRYGKLFAQEEVVFLSLPRHDLQERQRIIQSVLQIEQQH